MIFINNLLESNKKKLLTVATIHTLLGSDFKKPDLTWGLLCKQKQKAYYVTLLRYNWKYPGFMLWRPYMYISLSNTIHGLKQFSFSVV